MKLDPDQARRWCERLAQPYRHPASGVVAAIVAADETILRGFGRIDSSRPDAPDAATLFEIGSITKVFTSILLARLSQAGIIDMDVPIGATLRDFAGAPEWITPRALATHTSGLPRIPMPLWRAVFMDVTDPYARFSGADVVAWMRNYRPTRRPKPGRVSYSNLGVGLLGYILGEVASTGYEAALKREVLDPIGLRDTVIALDEHQRQRFATPHKANGKPTPPWSFDALAGAGALRSTAHDLAAFGRSVMDAQRGTGPLHSAIMTTLAEQVEGTGQCLGWVRVPPKVSETPIWFHDGGTLGSSSSLLVAPAAGVAAIVLANIGHSLRREIRIARSEPARLVAEIGEAVSARARRAP